MIKAGSTPALSRPPHPEVLLFSCNLFNFCTKQIFFASPGSAIWFSIFFVQEKEEKSPEAKCSPHPPVNKWDLYSIKEGPWWSSSVVYPAAKLTDGAGFPPFAVQTRVKFWAWYRLNGAGVFSATTDMLLGGAVDTETQRVRPVLVSRMETCKDCSLKFSSDEFHLLVRK